MKKLIPLFLAILMFTTACGKKTDAPSVSPHPPNVVVPSATPTPTPEPLYNPLTGEEISEEFGNSRPYAVMINNIDVALPHCGISQAEILYEVLAESNITRMVPIFSDVSDVEKVGSIRSSRPYYIEIAQSFDAIYVHAGGSEQAYADISSKGINNLDGVRGPYSGDVFYRDPNRQKYGSEHSLFATGEKIIAQAVKMGYPTEHSSQFDYGLDFTDTPDMTGAGLATTVDVNFGGIKHTAATYHSDGGTYSLAQYKQDLIDANNNETLMFKNILVLYADTQLIDDYGRRAVNLNTTGSGIFICDGKSVPITWSHLNSGDVFSYFKADGQPLELGRGRSYIAVVPTDSTITMA